MAIQVKERSATSSKNDTFISNQLKKAEQRIRLIDLVTALAGLFAGTLAYAVLMIFLDRQFVLSDTARQNGMLLFLLGTGAYVYFAIIRPFQWRINPYYAARQLEQTIPTDKNHVINWIDLQDEKLPGVIRAALGQRAAKDLSKADMERAISNRRALMMGGVCAALFVTFVTLFLLFGPRPFYSLFARTFVPFGKSSGIATRTSVQVVRPEGGDTTVTIGYPLTIVAQVDGRIPDAHDKDAPCLLYRHDENEPYRKRFLRHDDTQREWATTVGPLDVGNGFSYKVTAGDAETPVYRVKVRAAPLIGDFLTTYHFRSYVGRASRTRPGRKLEELRGTEAHILARTNRPVKEGRLEFEPTAGKFEQHFADLRADDPQSLRFRIVLDRPGKYRIRYTTTDGETYIDPVNYDVVVLTDAAPEVTLTQPGKNIQAPVNGQVQLAGEARDDIGLAGVTLRLEIVGGARLKSIPYLGDKLGKPPLGTPTRLEYKELLELPRLVDEKGAPAELKPGMEIEYWLEARDACDFPLPNITASVPHYRILLTPAENNPEQKKQQEQQRKEQKEHEKQKEDQLKKEQQQKQEQKAKEEAQEREDARKREEDRQNKGKGEEKPNDPNNKPEGDKNQTRPDEGKQGEKTEQQKKDEETKRKAEELKNALNNRDKEKEKEKEKGEQNKEKSSEKEKRPGEGKGEGETKPGEGKGSGDEKKPGQPDSKPGEGKDQGKEGGKPGESKDAGKDMNKQESSAKGENSSNPMNNKGEGKQAGKEGSAGKKPGEGKDAPSPTRKNDGAKGEGKDAGKGEKADKVGENKPAGSGKPEDQNKGEAKDSGTKGEPKPENRPGQSKEGKSGDKSEQKSGGREGAKAKQKQGQGKSGEKQDPMSKPGTCKDCPGGNKTGTDGTKPGEGKAGGMTGTGKPEDATKKEVEDLANQMRQGKGEAKEQAKRDLEQIRDKANDPGAREQAKQELQKKGTDQPGQGKSAGESPGGTGEKKPDDGSGKGQKQGEGKDGKEDPMNPAGMGKGAGKQGADQTGMTEADKGNSRGKGKGEQPGESDTPGTGGNRTGSGTGGSDNSPPPGREKPTAHRPSSLQLDEFKKKVDKDILREMKMSQQEYEKFLRDYSDLTRRQPATPGNDKEPTPTPGTAKGGLPSMGGKTIKPGGTSEDNLRNQGRPKAPPEYRQDQVEFLRKLMSPMK